MIFVEASEIAAFMSPILMSIERTGISLSIVKILVNVKETR